MTMTMTIDEIVSQRNAAVAAHEHVGRDAQVRNFGESGVRRGRQIAAE